jgi:hypothetical protein
MVKHGAFAVALVVGFLAAIPAGNPHFSLGLTCKLRYAVHVNCNYFVNPSVQ